MDLDDLLTRWNKGVLRGAARRLAEAVGVEESAVSRWRRGSPIAEDLRPKVAKILGVTVAEIAALRAGGASLIADAPSGIAPGSFSNVSELPRVPVLGVVSADRFSFSFDTFPEDHLPIPMGRGQKVFALRISGDCMEPTFRDGDYVIVSEQQQIRDGRIVLAQLDGEFTLKRYYLRADGVELRPDNKRYQPMRVATRALVIRGVVVGSYRKEP